MATLSNSRQVLDRVLNALKQVETVTSSSPEARQQFLSNYKDSFTSLFVQLLVHARERNELAFLQDLFESAYKSALPGVDLPKIPERKKPLEIFEGTSFEDALALLGKNMDNSVNLITIGKYLLSQVEKTKPKYIKTSKYEDAFKQVLDKKPQPIIKELFENLREACEKRLVDSETEASVKRAADERRKARLKEVANPTNAQKRAIAVLDKKSGKPATTTASASASTSKKSSSSSTTTSTIKKSTSTSTKSVQSATMKKPEQPVKKKRRPMTDAEYERLFLKRARETSIMADIEEERSRRIGAKEDREAVL